MSESFLSKQSRKTHWKDKLTNRKKKKDKQINTEKYNDNKTNRKNSERQIKRQVKMRGRVISHQGFAATIKWLTFLVSLFIFYLGLFLSAHSSPLN